MGPRLVAPARRGPRAAAVHAVAAGIGAAHPAQVVIAVGAALLVLRVQRVGDGERRQRPVGIPARYGNEWSSQSWWSRSEKCGNYSLDTRSKP